MIICDHCGTKDNWPGPVIVKILIEMEGWHSGEDREYRGQPWVLHLCKPCRMELKAKINKLINLEPL